MEETKKYANLGFKQFKQLPDDERKAIDRELGLDKSFAAINEAFAAERATLASVLRAANSSPADLVRLQAVAPEDVARERQRWMLRQHPEWSLLDWRTHTGLAYETLRKYWKNDPTCRIHYVRGKIAKAEKFTDVEAVPH